MSHKSEFQKVYVMDSSSMNIKCPKGLNSAFQKCRRNMSSAGWKLGIFILFLIVLSFVSFGMVSYSQYQLTRALSKTFLERYFGENFIQFEYAATVPDIWAFLENIAVQQLFSALSKENETHTFIMQVNLLLGLPRLRQLRVRNDSCSIHDDFRVHIYTCFDHYSESIESKDTFGPGNGTAWRYHTADELGSAWYEGRLNVYSGAGNFIDLGPGRQKAGRQISHLKEHFWISSATRVIFLDFTVYNANVNLFSIVKLVFELPPAGGVWSFSSIHTVKLFRYVTRWDYTIYVFEILFCCLTVYYLVEEIVEIRIQKLSYFMLKWNVLDFIILIFSIFVIAFGIYRSQLMNDLLSTLLLDPNHYPNFDIMSIWQMRYDDSVAILVFISWVKVFKYLSFNITMQQLSTTLAKCAKDVGGFAVMFFIIFLAYAQLGYLLFGTQLRDFSRLSTSFFSLLVIILGDFDYRMLVHANSVLGPIYFFTYIFFVYFILMNMFLAILSDTYTNVKAEMEEQNDDKFDCVKVLKKVLNKLKRMILKQPAKSVAVEQPGDIEIHEIEKTEMTEMPAKKANQPSKTSEVEKSVSVEEFVKLSNRVDDLHHEVEQFQLAILSKLVAVIEKLKKLTSVIPEPVS